MNVYDQLIRHEGLKLKPYKCPAGKLTIGVGRNIEDNGITVDEAEYLLRNDVTRVKEELRRNLSFFDDLSDARQAVLINMCFNLGWPRLSKFKKTLGYIDLGEYEHASIEMLNSKWAEQVGRRAIELSNMMFFGTWEQ